MKQYKKRIFGILLSLALALAMVAGALPIMTQMGHAAMSYDVYIDDGISNGVVITDKSETSGREETVTLTVTPGDGYKLKKLSVIQPDVLNSISDLVALMGDAVFSLENEYFVKIDGGKFSVFRNDEKIASLDNSENFTNTYGAGGYYTANTENSGFWRFYIIGGKLRAISFKYDNYDLYFTGIGAETISGTEIATTTVTEGTTYTFAAPASNVYVTAEFEMLDPKTVLIDVGAGHASLITNDVLANIKSEYNLEDATISGNIITLKGVDPQMTEGGMQFAIWSVIDGLTDLDGIHNGDYFLYVGYKPIDDYATEEEYEDDVYGDEHYETPISDGMTFYALWQKPYTKLEIDNGNPKCGMISWKAMPNVPKLDPENSYWKDGEGEFVESFKGGNEYTFNGQMYVYNWPGDYWKYYFNPDNFTMTVKDAKDFEYNFDGRSWIKFSYKATADHDWDEGTVTKEPTETADGVKTFKCKHCDATKTEVIPKKGSQTNAPKVTTTAKTSARAMTVKWTMKWGKVNGAKSYKVAYRKVGSKKWTYKNTKKTSYVVKGHKMKGLYEYKVAAVSKKGTVWSGTSRRYFNGVKANAKAARGAIKASWKKDKSATGYQVLVATNKKMNNSKVYNVSSSAKSYKVKGLKKGKTYYVRVRPMKKAGGVTYKGILSKIHKVKVK